MGNVPIGDAHLPTVHSQVVFITGSQVYAGFRTIQLVFYRSYTLVVDRWTHCAMTMISEASHLRHHEGSDMVKNVEYTIVQLMRIYISQEVTLFWSIFVRAYHFDK